jgi:hypothetical protein
MKKNVMLMAGLLAIAFAGSALAAGNPKLIVKDASGVVNKFTVTDTGDVTSGALYSDVVNSRVGVGATTPSTTLHVAADGVDPLRGFTNSQHNDGPQAGIINFVKSRGSQAAPTQPIAGDYIGGFTAQFWNGSVYDRSAQFAFRNDSTVSAGVFPTAIIFQTGSHTLPASDMSEAMRISSSKDTVVGNAGGSAVADMSTTVTNGFLYIPNVAGALSTCATVTTYTGHVPVWFDTASSKICTCYAGALKCTAALN